MSAYGVPGMGGVRKLTGMDLMPSAAMSMYMSIRSSIVSKPHNAATANFQPGFQSPFDGLQFVVVRMGGADIREIAAGSFQIIVVA